jgi:tRNA(Ile)-lysidine synthase
MQVSLAERLAAALGAVHGSSAWCVAYSGGCDSHVLLHLTAAHAVRGGGSVAALHVDHGVNPRSADWAEHCRTVCVALGVEYRHARLAPVATGHEAELRTRRYAALAEMLRNGETLLTAHHRDDQAETLLLQLLRGAGPAGLAAMPPLQPFAPGRHARPLLGAARAELHAYARAHGLHWIEDDGNTDTRIDRNFLRHEIMPRLARRWPALGATLPRVARHQADVVVLLEEIARADLKQIGGGSPERLKIDGLAELSGPRRDNVLRCWLRGLGLPVPAADQLQRIHDEVIGARPDAEPCLRWPGAELRRYRDLLYAGTPLPAPPDGVRRWRLGPPCVFEHGTLYAEQCSGGGLRRAACPDDTVEIRFRAGGERLRPAGRRGHRELRLLFQEQGVPPWQRDRIPLLFADGVLAAVADLWVAEEFAAAADEPAWRISWAAR